LGVPVMLAILGASGGRPARRMVGHSLVPGAVGHLLNSWSARWLAVSRLSQLTLAVPVVAVVGRPCSCTST
jgi:hypothetical protein